MTITRSAISYLLLLLLLARSFVPVGYMPVFGADGKVQIVICTGHGPATVSIDVGKSPHGTPHDGSGTAHDVCPFAPALADASAPADITPLPVVLYAQDKPALHPALTFTSLPPKPWFSHGPPALA